MRTKRTPAARRRAFHLLCKLTVELKKKRIRKSFQFFKTVKNKKSSLNFHFSLLVQLEVSINNQVLLDTNQYLKHL